MRQPPLNPLAWPDAALEKLDNLLERAGRGRAGDAPLAAVLLIPAFSILGLFGIAPLFYAFYISLFGGKQGVGVFNGLGNYADALTRSEFWNSLLVTAYYAAGVVPVSMTLSFLIAYGLYRISRAQALLRIAYFLPYVTSAVAAAMVWRAVLAPNTGLANALLDYIGLPVQQWLLEPRSILNILSGGLLHERFGPSLALCCIIAFDIWHASGFMIVVFLAGLTAMPRELEEAARLDGAGTPQLLRHVVLPVLSPAFFFLAVVGAIKAFQAFNSFYALTQGSRTLGTTENLVMHIYANFYEYGYWGYGAAVATLLTLAIVILTLIQWYFIGKKVYYQ